MSEINENLTEDQIQSMLAAGPVRGPLSFRSLPLADYTAGLRDLVLKVVRPDDTIYFHDFTLIHILSEAYGSTPEDVRSKRRALIAATDDVTTYRAHISLDFIDSLSEREIAELRSLAESILEPVELAQVMIVSSTPGIKKNDVEAPKPFPTPTPSTSLPSEESPAET